MPTSLTSSVASNATGTVTIPLHTPRTLSSPSPSARLCAPPTLLLCEPFYMLALFPAKTRFAHPASAEPSAPPSPNKLNASYNTAVQRWFKKQLPQWVRCTEGWREELSLIGECEAKWEALAALEEWKKTYAFATKEKRNRRDRCAYTHHRVGLLRGATPSLSSSL